MNFLDRFFKTIKSKKKRRCFYQFYYHGVILVFLMIFLTPNINAEDSLWDTERILGFSDDIPDDFDWKTYVENYEDLRKAGIVTKEKAIEHWRTFGIKEKRTYKKLVVPKSQRVLTKDEAMEESLVYWQKRWDEVS